MAEDEKKPVGSLMDTGVPSQMDEEDLKAEMEIELPGSLDTNVVQFDGEAQDMDIEITADDDGGVTVDFEPTDM